MHGTVRVKIDLSTGNTKLLRIRLSAREKSSHVDEK